MTYKPEQPKLSDLMPYPKKYVGRYSHLTDYLVNHGFAVYPMEMIAREIVHKKNYVVDVVAEKGNLIWAFEYKSFTDSVKHAILQVENYSKCFDFVVIVGANLKQLIKYRKEFQTLGVGIWHINKNIVTVLDEPVKQPPISLKILDNNHPHCKTIRDVMMDKFLINTGRKKRREKIVALGEFYEGIKQVQLTEYTK